MNLFEVLHVVGALVAWTAVAMLPAAFVGVGEGLAVPWLLTAAGTAALGLLVWFATPRDISINPREGLAVVGLGWIAVVLVGSVPFMATGVAPTPWAAFFESASGFTTTGATVYAEIEALPASILLWRSTTHWLGGMGIIVLGVAILPLIGMGGAQLFRAEAPGISSDRLTPRIASTARLLWVVYALFTAVLGVIYVALGMSPFDAVNHALSCLATGGFSTRTASLGAFSPAIQWVTVLFMFVAGINFTLHYRLLTGRWDAWLKDTEWRWFAGLVVGSVVAVAIGLAVVERGMSQDVARRAVFNVTAIATTTGFVTTDFGAWPHFAQLMLLGLMFTGAMGGSTAGGFKVVRLIVVIKHVAGEIRKILHPRAVIVTKLGDRPVREDIVLNVLAYLALYMLTHAIGTVILAALGSDIVTALSAALAAMSSIGPGLGVVGPVGHYGDLVPAAHVVLGVLMLLGRLEFYTLLVLVIPGTWSRWGGHR